MDSLAVSGPKPKYGKQAISLAKRASHRSGWRVEKFVLYGEEVAKTYKTFLATYKVAYGLIRVVLVKEADRWEAFFCTDPEASVAQVLQAYADRAAIEKAQADYPSRRRWGGARRIGYHRDSGVTRAGRVVPATPGRSHRRSRMSDTTRRPAPPRA